MAKLSSLRIDTLKAREGRWVEYEGIRFKIASMGSPEFRQHRDRLMRPHIKKSRRGHLSGEEITKIQVPAIAKHVLVGWEKLEDDAGQPIPYSAGTAEKILDDPSYRDLYDFVLEEANDFEAFKREALEDARGN